MRRSFRSEVEATREPMFDVILKELIDSVPGARGAVFCDPLGETVNAVGASGRTAPHEQDDFDLRVAGAQLATPLELAARDNEHVGPILEATITGPRETLLVHLLKDGYYLVLCLEPRALSGLGRHRLRQVAARVDAEI